MRKLLTALFSAAMVFAVPSAQAAPPAQPSATVKLPKPVLPKVPTAPAVLAMLRSTLIAVDQGNKTGNYTVVRDLGTPGFREANTPAKLGLVFAPLVDQGVDMLPVLVVEPQYREAPRLTARRMLYVAGSFNIQPRRVSFELLFDVWHGEWRLFGVSIVPG